MKNKFKRIKSLILILLLTLMTISTNIRITKAEALDSDIVTFEDANLEAVVRKKLAKASGDITVGDMRSMTGEFCAHNKNISSLKGLEHAVNIDELCLYGNQISDIASLKDMVKLRYLHLYENQISDITPLKDMTSLQGLDLNNNQISDITPLKDMTNLETLYLENNQISDITPLKDMTNLIRLSLYNNQISDITPLKNLINLGKLYLRNNKIKNIDAIREMTWITGINVNDNLIEEIPTWFNELPNLTFINMSRNKLKGTIPPNIGELTSLKELSLDDNFLTGDIPVELNNLTKLTVDEEWNSFKNNYFTGTVPDGLKSKVGAASFDGNLLEGETNQKQLTIINGAELNLSLNSSVTSNTLKSITKLFDGEDSHSKSLYELELVPTDESFFDESGRAIKSGSTTAYIKIKDVAESNPYTKTLTTVQVNISDKIGSNSDITIEFSIDNALEVILGANNINFGNVSAEGGEVEATTLTVTSSLPYDISTKAYNDFIGSSDPSNIIPIEKVSLDIDDLGYIELSKGKTLNLGDNPSAIDKIHNLNFKISDTLGYKKDNYRAELQFIIDTK